MEIDNIEPNQLDRPIRVVHVIDTLNVGGAEMLLPVLCQHEHASNIKSSVIALRPGVGTEIARVLDALDVQVEVVATARRRQMLDLGRILKLKRLFIAGDFDLVHTHLRVATIFGAVAGRLARLPVVTTLHNVRTDAGIGGVNRIKDYLETLVLRKTVSIAIACGPTVASSNAERIQSTPMRTVANPVREIPQLAATDRQRIRDEVLGDSNGPLMLAVGRLTRQKAFENLVSAFSRVSKDVPAARLVIVGDGEERQSLETQISQLGLGTKILLPGVRNDIPALLRSADVFAMPSRWEGLPVALLEAMAAELPIVATTVGDISWAAGDTITLVAPESVAEFEGALLNLLANPAAAKRQGQRARERALQRHGAIEWVRALRTVYDEACAYGPR